MSCPVYLCRLCDSQFHETLEVIDIFSTEGKQLKVAAKIFFVMYVMVSFCVVFAAKVMVIVVDLAIK
jgi:hypothetical protein